MGIMDVLKKVVGVAAPIVGGVVAGPAGIAGGSALGGILGGAAGGMADERGRQNIATGTANAARTSQYGIEQNATANLLAQAEKAALDRAALGMAAPDRRASQGVRGSILANAQDAKITHPRATIPGVSGGLKPSIMSPMARQMGHDLQNQAYDAMQSGSDVPAMTDFMGKGMVKPPELEEYQDPGTLENIATGGSLAANIIAQLMQQGNRPPIEQQRPMYGPPANMAGPDPDEYGEYGG